MIKLEVYLNKGENEWNPKAGWHLVGTFETVKEAAECYNRAETIIIRAGKSVDRLFRIVIEGDEDIKRHLYENKNDKH